MLVGTNATSKVGRNAPVFFIDVTSNLGTPGLRFPERMAKRGEAGGIHPAVNRQPSYTPSGSRPLQKGCSCRSISIRRLSHNREWHKKKSTTPEKSCDCCVGESISATSSLAESGQLSTTELQRTRSGRRCKSWHR